MGRLTRLEFAERAGADVAFVDRLVELGVMDPEADEGFDDGAVRRVRVVQLLVRSGISLDGLATMVASGQLPLEMVEAATEDRFAPFGTETFAALSERTGIPFELLAGIRQAMGSAHPGPDERVREDELRVVPLVEYWLQLGIRPAIVERTLRVCAESLRRMAETEAEWWYTDLVMPRRAAGMTWKDIAAMAGETGGELSRRTDEALLAVYHAQQSNAWMRNILEGVESALVQAGLQQRPDRAPPAVCFLDITGYTRLTEERGDEAAGLLADQLGRVVQRTSSQHGGKAVKSLGDGVMFVFPEPARGVAAALDMVEAAAATGLPPARVGLHAGPVLFQDGDYFGRTVNVAARIADYARPGEVVVSESVVAGGPPPGIGFAEIGEVELKGVAGTHRLHIAKRLAAASEAA